MISADFTALCRSVDGHFSLDGRKLKFEQESAMNFIQTVVRPRKDRVLFATFDHEIALKQDFTDKLDLLDRAVFGVKKLGNQTALYDAIWQFCDEKLRSVPGQARASSDH